MSSDERLALRAAQGDERAFAEIYERYHQDLYRFCLAMVGNPQDAQDALQNAMVKVLRALPGEKREIKLKPWLYRIVRNEAVEVLRRRRDSAELEPDQATSPGVVETAEARERLRTLLTDLEQLPERQRAALLMRELSGLDFTEIGTAFGSTAAVARQALYEARLSLRQLEAGREMRCADVMRKLSDADGRVARGREIRAHLRSCADCRAFHDDIAKRHDELAGLAPLPIAASTALLHGALGQAGANGASVAGGGLSATAGAGTGKAIATSAIAKSAATVAVVAVVGASAAGRSGLIEVPIVARGGHDSAVSEPVSRHGPAGAGDPTDATPAAPASGASAGARRPSDSSAGRHSGRGYGGGRMSSPAAGDALGDESAPSSQAGLSPPGGGYGRPASERRGRPEQAPAAAEHGQQTAAPHKPAETGSPSGRGAVSEDHGRSSGGRNSDSTGPATPPKPPPATAPPASQAPAETPSQGTGGPAESGAGGALPGHER
jgi:RNA polymerase sigma factor (sigma-70 family)